MERKHQSKTLINNIGFLTLLQFVNLVAPFLLLPILSRSLPVEEFGVVMVVMAAVQIAYVITDYGFNVSATYVVSKNRNKKNEIETVVSEIFTSKIVLCVVALACLVIISLLPAYKGFELYFYAATGAVIAQAYQPTWLFHGLNKMKLYSIYMAMIKLTHLALVWFFVDSKGDGIVVLISWSFANILGAYVAVLSYKKLGYTLRVSSFRVGIMKLKSNFEYFLSRASVALYTSSSTLFVGSTGLKNASVYGSAEQLYKGCQAVAAPVSQALFPQLSKDKNIKLFYTVVSITATCVLIGSVFVHTYADLFIEVIFGKDYLSAVPVLKVLMIAVFFNYLAVCFGYPAFALIDSVRVANNTVILGALFFILILACLFYLSKLTPVNVAWAVCVTEATVLLSRVACFQYLKNRRENMNNVKKIA